jgi:pimeloyl-ACP methyl ester carboxylesterase
LTFNRAGADFVIDPSPHKASFVTVDKGVKLEVLDWGGSGPPLVFLAGLGNTRAQVRQVRAQLHSPSIMSMHHPARHRHLQHPAPTIANYDADRLGDDVLQVIEALKLDRPVLAAIRSRARN